MSDPTNTPYIDDATAFKNAMQDVSPLPPAGRHYYVPPLPPPVPMAKRSSLSQKHVAWNDHFSFEHVTAFLAKGQPRQILRDLKRGHFRPCAELDLHGFNRHEAREQLHLFLEEAYQYQERCVCVIPGKGLRSSNGEPILKILVKGWLAQSERVRAFSEAPASSGGSGALFVLIHTKNLEPDQKYR